MFKKRIKGKYELILFILFVAAAVSLPILFLLGIKLQSRLIGMILFAPVSYIVFYIGVMTDLVFMDKAKRGLEKHTDEIYERLISKQNRRG